MPARLFLVIVLLAVGATEVAHASSYGGRSSYSALNQQNRAVCATRGGVHRFSSVVLATKDVASCTAGCFRYRLTCENNASYTLTARYFPYADDRDIFWLKSGGLLKLLIFAVIAFYGVVATFGTRDSEERAIAAIGNAVCIVLIGFNLWMWGAIALGSEGAQLFDVFVDPLVTFIVFPVFIVARVGAFRRGWDYFFVRHPAESLISPAVNVQASVDTTSLAREPAGGATDPGEAAVYHYEHQAARARDLKDEIDAKATAIEARAQRELRRAELAEAKRHLEEAQRRSEKPT